MILSNTKRGKYEQPFSIKILDDNFNLVTLISYDNLQWNRTFNTVGKFIIEGVEGQEPFNKNTWKYVYSEKRSELGKISQVNWKKDADRETLTISGLFAESDLNKMVCYAKPTHFDDDSGVHPGTSILSTGSPTWVTQDGTADVVARAFFEGFKQVSFRNYLVRDFDGAEMVTRTFALPITFGTIAPGNYHRAIHNRNNEYLGNKLYDILKESYAAPKIKFDYDTKVETLNIVHGVVRTQGGHEYGVNPILLSTKNGSIKSASIVTSNTKTKDAVLQYAEDESQTLILANALDGSEGRFQVEQIKSNQADFNSDNAYKLSVMADASTRLHELEDVINIQFDFVNSSYKYMEDFDLGDIISVDIPEIGISIDTQIVSCYEVIKGGVWSLDIEIGKAIMRKRGNV